MSKNSYREHDQADARGANPIVSAWLQYALPTALERKDKIEAACDAAFLLMILIRRMRAEEATQ